MTISNNIILVGPMGAGKTTIGRQLAKKLSIKFFDSDHEIEQRTGVKIALIFEIEGEEGFRKRESQIINELTSMDKIVLSTGGGAVLKEENRQILKENGYIIYLKSSPEMLFNRTKDDKRRPLLQGENRLERIRNILAEREPLYISLADEIVDTDKMSIKQIINKSLELIEKMKLIDVDLAERSYSIHIGDTVLADKKLVNEKITSSQILVVTNEIVAPLHLQALEKNLVDMDYDVIVLPDGEQFKSLDSFNQIITRLMEKKFNRTCLLIALGGGVIGDLTGFVAASYQRGVKFIQIPTTLLAQVDSSVGGKTAVNHPLGKNMIGAFYQPTVVLADTSVLSTLPDRELSAGLAEVIKYGLIRDKAFYEWLEGNITGLINRDNETLTYAIERSCINKAEVVTEDERESGIRATLNLGHTFGHAIETALSYKGWLHGEAVGCGMLMAADLSMRLGYMKQDQVDRIKTLLEKAKLPTKIHKDVSLKQMLENMKIDKKARDGVVYLILLNDIGEAIITSDYTEQVLTETINHFLE